MTCTPCRVTHEGTRYAVAADGTVRPTWIVDAVNGGMATSATPAADRRREFGDAVDATLAKAVRHEAARQRRNRNSRERNQAMRDLGMKRTPYGWE